ncbi:histidine phosphatase family protein [Novosphingobium sp. JCM 18896]|uniref:histidine phosphatase family protein n=1 Tax=Novosphingobium sp. JCM 18896 TaxID=2989731 RepID=UPI0022237543|nr:histidine phosphatase family protein [Novosphingobium sp. JCM 18896]MCW1427484.1 histidine phosphatase family protein [Novosphingobium sp. JCM 18896]
MSEGFRLHLLRHGAPEVPGLLLGRSDAAPTPGGIAACVERTRDLAVEAIVSSDLSRAAAAAGAIAESRNLKSTSDPRWRELDFGIWDGRAPHEIDAQALARFWDDPDAYAPPQGERWSDLVARVGTAIGELSPRDTLIVTHGGAMRAALSVLCGFDHRFGWALDLPYAALLTFRVWPGDRPGDRPAGQVVGLRT